ncbi:phosphoribosylanthranilate isomerase [Sandaracinobacteroides sp. A072]|uniref:phosphoribosylanthranilate isomerase n=1 Tax=Sandaracinobacteroides sp. A072 TaxID=3461146 RepID=UPI0040428DFA
MRTKVKICGITTPEALVAALSAGADAAGFVFYPPSPRAIDPERAGALAARAPHLLKVGVFVDPDDALLDAAVAGGRLGAIQLQGDEGPARVAAIRQRFGIPVWRAVGVRTAEDIRAATRDFSGADLLLLDAKAPEGAVLPGGNGLRFDWRLLEAGRPAMAWGLAGGLSPETVADAIRLAGAPLVDVSSGVEDAPGVKNLAKIAAFVEAARRA